MGLAVRAEGPTLEGAGGVRGSTVWVVGLKAHQSGSEADRRKGGRGVLGHSRRGLLKFRGYRVMGFEARGGW